MSKKGTIEVFQSKISRNDRFAQMSHQEKLIEQKKREIQAKLEQKQKAAAAENKTSSNASKNSKSPIKPVDKKPFNFNTFSNDGSFLNQFKQMKEKKLEQQKSKFKSRDNHDRFSDDRNKNKWKRDLPNKEQRVAKRPSRFSDSNKPPSYEPKININTTYSNLLSQQNFDGQSIVTAQDVTGQPLLKNLISSQSVQYPLSPQNTTSVIAAPPLLLNVPPPQLQLQSTIQTTLVLPPTSIEMSVGVDLCPTTVITAVTLPSQAQPHQVVAADNNIIAVPPPNCMPTLELANIPPPNPIQVHNIPQPEPINTMTIPPPAPMQVQNIPPPSPIQLNEIPNPKPLDILSIPTPNEATLDKNMSDPDFIKNVPPPNKSVPPPLISEAKMNISIPPPPPIQSTNVPTCLPPPNIMPPTSMPPPPPPQQQTLQQNLSLATITQNLLVPPPQNSQPPPPQPILNTQTLLNAQSLSTLQNLPPPTQNSNLLTMTMQNVLQMQAGQVPVSNAIPPLMAQPILPPPGMGIVPPPMNINCPPPILQPQQPTIQLPPPGFINQPLPSQIVSMSVPPPQAALQLSQQRSLQVLKDMSTGSADYEAMASLGRMVAQCGPGIEEVVRQRKNQDPSLWFLFHKDSAAYQQYQQLVEQFRIELNVDKKSEDYKPEDIYEPEAALDEDDNDRLFSKEEDRRQSRRKRKSRWGDKDESIAPPGIALPAPGTSQTGHVTLSTVTRSDPGLIQYAINTYGSVNITDEDWKKAEENYKINLLYQDMLRKRQEVERLQNAGRNKYDYDSDEDIDGGTWEHKLREKEMTATQIWSTELTKHGEGKHHIGDFLPPDEFKKFMEKSQAIKDGRPLDVSDYQEFKLNEDNVGFKMLQKLGWTEGKGLGSDGKGILEPINKGTMRDTNQGLGLDQDENLNTNDDEYDAYRKRMMLAYRFRPNPLNNPRRPYY